MHLVGKPNNVIYNLLEISQAMLEKVYVFLNRNLQFYFKEQ